MNACESGRDAPVARLYTQSLAKVDGGKAAQIGRLCNLSYKLINIKIKIFIFIDFKAQ